jgi:hypothetical protein
MSKSSCQPGKVSNRKGREDPSLVVERPFEVVRHLDDGDGHDDPVRRVDEVGQRAEHDQPEAFRQEVETNHHNNKW